MSFIYIMFGFVKFIFGTKRIVNNIVNKKEDLNKNYFENIISIFQSSNNVFETYIILMFTS